MYTNHVHDRNPQLSSFYSMPQAYDVGLASWHFSSVRARPKHDTDKLWYIHRRRSGWTSGGTHGERRRWVRAEWGGIWGGVSPLQPTKGSGWASWASPAGSGAEPRQKTDLAYFEGHRTLIFVPIWQNLWGTICISVPRSKFWGDLSKSPCPPPWSTPMGTLRVRPAAAANLILTACTIWQHSM